MTWSQLPFNPAARVLRQFAAAWLVLFAALAIHRAVRHGTDGLFWTFLALTAPGVLGLIRPGLVRWLFVAASVAAFPIGWVVTHLVLGFLFYVVLTPVALFFRVRKRDELRLRRTERETCWETKEPTHDPARYLRQH